MIAQSQIALMSRFGAALFTIGKLIRFGFFLFFLFVLVDKTKAVAGYTLWEVILFFATFNFIDVTVQFLFRDVYRFRTYVINGYFDNLLIKPFSILFRCLLGGSDLLDGIMIVLSLSLIILSFQHVHTNIVGIFLYMSLVVNAFMIALSFHIFVLGIGILSTAVDNTIMLYRDLTQMGRVPIDVYKQPLRDLITFVIPVGIMMAFPVKAILGLLSVQTIMIALTISCLMFYGSLLFWRYALRHYTSVSS